MINNNYHTAFLAVYEKGHQVTIPVGDEYSNYPGYTCISVSCIHQFLHTETIKQHVVWTSLTRSCSACYCMAKDMNCISIDVPKAMNISDKAYQFVLMTTKLNIDLF